MVNFHQVGGTYKQEQICTKNLSCPWLVKNLFASIITRLMRTYLKQTMSVYIMNKIKHAHAQLKLYPCLHDIRTSRLITKHTFNPLKNLTVTLLQPSSKQQMHFQALVYRLS